MRKNQIGLLEINSEIAIHACILFRYAVLSKQFVKLKEMLFPCYDSIYSLSRVCCACVHVCVLVHTCTHVQLDVSTSVCLYICLYEHRETRSRCWVSSWLFFLYCMETGSLTEPGLRLTVQKASEILLSQPSQCWGYRHKPP